MAIVTGSNTGLGQGICRAYAEAGAKVVGVSRRPSTETEEMLGKENFYNVIADLSSCDVIPEIVQKTIERFGRIDILINNAGISMRGLFIECKTETLRRLMDTNFWGTVYCSKYALPYLLQKRGSSIVGISSIAGYQSLPARAAYSASKAAIQSLMQTLRIENKKKGLHVMVACPGFTASHVRENALDKDGNPQGKTPREEDKMMTAERVAHLIANGIKHKRRSLIMTPLGKITVFVEKFWPQLTEAVAYSYMAKEPDSPFK